MSSVNHSRSRLDLPEPKDQLTTAKPPEEEASNAAASRIAASAFTDKSSRRKKKSLRSSKKRAHGATTSPKTMGIVASPSSNVTTTNSWMSPHKETNRIAPLAPGVEPEKDTLMHISKRSTKSKSKELPLPPLPDAPAAEPPAPAQSLGSENPRLSLKTAAPSEVTPSSLLHTQAKLRMVIVGCSVLVILVVILIVVLLVLPHSTRKPLSTNTSNPDFINIANNTFTNDTSNITNPASVDPIG